MQELAFQRIKQKMLSVGVKRYWGDDYDVRFYLISKLKHIKNKRVLDLGGGIGAVSSELDASNLIVNLDLAIDDLKICKNSNGYLELICSSMLELPFQNNEFDVIICAHVIEEIKNVDLNKKNTKTNKNINEYPSVMNAFSEMNRILKNGGILYLTTPNNSYYKTTKFTFEELKHALENSFSKFSIFLFNTYPKTSKKFRKLNMANIFPKIRSKFESKQKILDSLIELATPEKIKSVSFYVEATKD
ncbi:class I SAM-dependent methyltransferase [Candidatus Nitrosotenuis uzonensis]|uniref:Methyltransferase type 11 domain-containing protein n=1 Tax=Candidatus Nitrosotenuis uzonensis TaxID=1407055 RepID=V6AV89_9ARCH|nr:class I SAM-dependent methyltransferase [Candidatus Nitrosotenuis uzonensis]CDI06464.1 hypothetical protein NITUZ_50011 [Candidatus Nitrosotenuis uzonensis]